jgi:xanthine dehydrogenase YagT iron-sulfur-binding subunit
MSGAAVIAGGRASSPQAVREWMSGNLCRCGAYPGITAAVLDAAGRSGVPQEARVARAEYHLGLLERIAEDGA